MTEPGEGVGHDEPGAARGRRSSPDERRRGIRRTAIALALLALGFYVAVIVTTGASN